MGGLLALIAYLIAASSIVVAMFLPGYVLADIMFRSMSDDERLVLSFGLSAAIYGLLAMAIYASPAPFPVTSAAGVIILLTLSIYFFIRRKMTVRLRKANKFPLYVLLFVYLFAILFVALPGDTPNTLDAGTYYSAKAPYLPGDTYIPFRVAQFMVNDLKIDNEPFYADWFYSDRTPLMGAVTADFEVVFRQKVPPRYLYLYPDHSWKLIDVQGYWLYRLIASLLCCMALLPTYLIARRFFNETVARLTLLFLAVNAYFLVNTFYTWPKLMLAYYLVLAFYFIAENRYYVFAGAMLGLSYLSHPLAALFMPGALVYILFETGFRKESWIRWLKIAGGVLLISSPWFIWAMLIYRHPSRMMTYPLGYIITNPLNSRQEIAYALDMFTKRSIASVLNDRFTIFVETMTPSLQNVSFISQALPGLLHGASFKETLKAIHAPIVTMYYHTIPGMLALSLWVFTCYGLLVSLRSRLNYIFSFMAVPFLCVLAFWGVWPRGVGMDVLQPMLLLLLPFGIYTLWLIGRRWFTGLIFGLASLEFVAILWLGIGGLKFVEFINHPTIAGLCTFGVLVAWYLLIARMVMQVKESTPRTLANTG